MEKWMRGILYANADGWNGVEDSESGAISSSAGLSDHD
jgi:hypothetical protein